MKPLTCPECGYRGEERYCPVCNKQERIIRLREVEALPMGETPPTEKEPPSSPEQSVVVEPPPKTDPDRWFRVALEEAVRRTGNLWLIYSGAGMEASGRGQRPTQMAFELTKTSICLFVSKYEPLEIQANLFRCTPAHLMKMLPQLHISESVQPNALLAYPDKVGMALADIFVADRNWFLIYDCIDFWPGFPEITEIDANEEARLIKLVDMVTVSARKLEEWAEWMGAEKDVVYLPNAASWNLWKEPLSPPKDLVRGKVTILYSGHLTGSWIDQELLSSLVSFGKDLGWAFNLIGDIPTDPIPGAYYLGHKPYKELGNYLRYVDIGIIPFKENILTECVSPLKVFDYLCADVPVVSTPMPELDYFPYCIQANSFKEFRDAIPIASMGKINQETTNKFRRENSWQARIAFLKHRIAEIRQPVTPKGSPSVVVENEQEEQDPVLQKMEERLLEGLYRPEYANHRVAWLCGTTCGYKCPYCSAKLSPSLQPSPYSPDEQKSAWAFWLRKYGPAQIVASGLESLHSNDTRNVLAHLSHEHILSINTNLAFALSEIAHFNSDNVFLSASYHPYSRVPLNKFLEKIDAIQNRGIQVTGVSCVLYPPILSKIPGYRDQIEKAGHFFLAHVFDGPWQGKKYPSSYDSTQLEIVKSMLEEDSWKYNIERQSSYGKLCWAGHSYSCIGYEGLWYRCPVTLPRRNFFECKAELSRFPEPCPSKTGCHCDDLWRYILTNEEVAALTGNK